MKLFPLFLSLSLLIIITSNEGPLQYPEPAEGWDDGDCHSLKSQSPIVIPPDYDKSVVLDNGDKAKIISMDYSKITKAKLAFDHSHKWTTAELDAGNLKIKIDGKDFNYKLHSVHFHLYSEHRFQNTQYPMEMHMVHKNVNKADKENENLVIAVLFDYKNNKKNHFLEEMKFAKEKEIKSADIKSLINKNDRFYYYKGGLTTVPCSENVNWVVFKDIRDFSYEQFKEFRDWVQNSGPKYYGTGYGNARGPKPINDRKIYLENDDEDNYSSDM